MIVLHFVFYVKFSCNNILVLYNIVLLCMLFKYVDRMYAMPTLHPLIFFTDSQINRSIRFVYNYFYIYDFVIWLFTKNSTICYELSRITTSNIYSKSFCGLLLLYNEMLLFIDSLKCLLRRIYALLRNECKLCNQMNLFFSFFMNSVTFACLLKM